MIRLTHVPAWLKRRSAVALPRKIKPRHRRSAATCEPLETRVLLSNNFVIATFNGANGSTPYSGLIADTSGNLYGTTYHGGANSDGTVFEIAAGTQSITTLLSFAGGSTGNIGPYYGPLVLDNSGNLYGTTLSGGADSDGTVFEIAAGTESVTTLVTFNSTNGSAPQAGLIFDASGNLYGTTSQGGANSDGTVFEIAAGTQSLTTLVSFNGTNGQRPEDSLVFDSNGNLYGTTSQGGADSDGTVFELAAGTHSLTTLVTFNSTNGRNPVSGLIFDSSGNLYGTTLLGGSKSDGNVFEIAAGTESLTTLVTFTGTNGSNPEGDLVFDSFGNLYGTTSGGGANGYGEVFKIAASTESLTTLVTFTHTNGASPVGGLMFDSAGRLYGTASAGGANSDGDIFELYPNAVPTELAFAQQPSTVTAGIADSPAITVDVEDQYGNLVATDNSNVTLAINSGPGALTGTLTVAAVNGVATFNNVILDTAGPYTLSATDGNLTAATSNSFTVNPAAASMLTFGQPPTNATAGVADSPAITVKAEDQFGNVVTNNSSNITLAVHTGPGSLSGTVTVAAVNGVATFNNVSMDIAGNYTLIATNGSATAATSSTFTITHAAAAELAFAVQPTNVTAGVPESPDMVLDVVDSFGNIVTTDNSYVTLSLSSGPGPLSGTLTVQAVNGVATFTNVSMHTAGPYALTAADGNLIDATSAGFTVNPAAAAVLVFNQQPSNTATGVADSPAITVDVDDQFGNLVTTDASTITLAAASGPGSLSGTLTAQAVNGVATFSNVSLHIAGAYLLSATNGVLPVATSNSFTVSPSVASHLVFAQQPANVTAGVADTPSITVDVEDQFNNILTTDSSTTITLAAASGPGSLSGTLSAQAVNGVATFSNVSVDTAGNYLLSATNGVLPIATSASFTVNPAAAAVLVFAVQPSNGSVGVPDSPNTIVDIEDQFGNLVTSDNSAVTLAIATGPGTLSGTLTVNAGAGVAAFNNLLLSANGTYTLQATSASLPTATSNSFTIGASGPLTLTDPASAATVNVASTFEIDWTGGNAGDTVQIWAEGGPNNSWIELTSGVPDSQGHFDWNTTGVGHGWYYFLAWDLPSGGGTAYSVVSPNYLHVVAASVTQPPTITLLNPVLAGETDAQGASYTINWTTTEQNTDTNPLFAQLWIHNGTTNAWSVLPNANSIATGSSGSYVWNTTNVAPGWYSFTAHITDGDMWGVGGPQFNSPGWIDITVPAPTITYLTPSASQSAAAGGTFNLTWSISGLPSSDVSNATVQIWAQYLNNGTSVWTEIAASVNAANGAYTWTVPSSPGAGTYYAFSMWMNYGNDWWIQASPNWLQIT